MQEAGQRWLALPSRAVVQANPYPGLRSPPSFHRAAFHNPDASLKATPARDSEMVVPLVSVFKKYTDVAEAEAVKYEISSGHQGPATSFLRTFEISDHGRLI